MFLLVQEAGFSEDLVSPQRCSSQDWKDGFKQQKTMQLLKSL